LSLLLDGEYDEKATFIFTDWLSALISDILGNFPS
jgi:hypothetical protein